MHEALALADALMSDSPDAFNDTATIDAVSRFEALLKQARHGEHTLHGKRVEAMFRFVAASLGQCQLIKEEDSGDFYSRNADVTPPDYTVILTTGERILVEVKNHHRQTPEPWFIRERDVRSLERYAAIQRAQLFFAIFWSRPRIWTLVPSDRLQSSSSAGKRTIEFTRALAINHMSQILGDKMLATKPPLRFRVSGDFVKDTASTTHSQPSIDSLVRNYHFRISGVELFCAEAKIDDEFERGLAMYFMLHGSWRESDWQPVGTGEHLTGMELQFEPEDVISGQEFQMIGTLSTLITRAYDDLTIHERKVRRLRANAAPDELGIAIPNDYVGRSLPLWRFTLKPNFDFTQTP